MDADREFWWAVRRALLAFVTAIEKRYGFEKGDRNASS